MRQLFPASNQGTSLDACPVRVRIYAALVKAVMSHLQAGLRGARAHRMVRQEQQSLPTRRVLQTLPAFCFAPPTPLHQLLEICSCLAPMALVRPDPDITTTPETTWWHAHTEGSSEPACAPAASKSDLSACLPCGGRCQASAASTTAPIASLFAFMHGFCSRVPGL